MLLKVKVSGSLVEVCNLSELMDPCTKRIHIRELRGYKNAQPVHLQKSDLTFVSGEPLPTCWLQVHLNYSVRQAPHAKAS
ncbi:hypothetical protein [Sessilibacter sp. MAH4]